jgi:uncharacterized protein (TIGR02246 family)
MRFLIQNIRRSMRPAVHAVFVMVWAMFIPGHASAASSECRFTNADATGIRAVVDAYRTAWLKGDATGVLNTLTVDAVLLPSHGARPIVGRAAISAYWWPAGAPPSRVTKLDITVEGLAGDCAVASSYGRDDVAWTQDEKGTTRAYGHPGTYLDVFRKVPDGTWRISRHMWDDGPADK